MKTRYLIVLVLTLTACANTAQHTARSAAPHKGESLHSYIRTLSQQLFQSTRKLQGNESIAVGSFLPLNDLEGKNLPAASTLGQQVQESFITLTTQAGLNVVEFKTTQTLKLASNLDIMLSRDLKRINKNINIDYYLTGTYAYSYAGLSINARLIDVSTSNVVAAATHVIPRHLASSSGNDTVSQYMSSSHQLYHLK